MEKYTGLPGRGAKSAGARDTTLGFAVSREGIPAGGKLALRITCTWQPEGGTVELGAMADDVDRIPELDETNNAAVFTMKVAD